MSPHPRHLLAILVSLAVPAAPAALGGDDVPATKETPPAPPAPAAAAQPAPPSKPAIDALVRQLSHDDWKLREKAQEELARFGPEAVPTLEALLNETKDPELRARAEGVLDQIGENQATGPTFVTLKLSDGAPAAAFEDVARQAGAKLETQPPALLQRDDLPRVTIDAERQPFWEVMRKLCAACKVRPERSGGGKLVLAADDGSWGKRPYVTSGPFIVTANELYVTRAVRFGIDPPAEAPAGAPGAGAPAPVPQPPIGLRVGGFGPDDGVRDHAQLQVSGMFEPKLQGMAWSPGTVVEATDDAGRTLVLARGAEPRRRAVYGGARTSEWEATVWLGVPPNDRAVDGRNDRAKPRLARLKFLSSFTVRSGVERWEIPDVLSAKDVERIAGPTRVVFKGLTRLPNDQYELNVASYPAGNPQAWRAVEAGHAGGGPRLLDAGGRELMRAGGSTSMSADVHTSQLRFAPDRGPAGANGRVPAKLVWDLPTGVQQFQVPVEFEDLTMP